MQSLEVSGAVRPIYGSLRVKRLTTILEVRVVLDCHTLYTVKPLTKDQALGGFTVLSVTFHCVRTRSTSVRVCSILPSRT